MKKILFCTLLLALLTNCSGPKSNQIESYLGFAIQQNALDSFIHSKMQAHKIPGLSLAIINNNDVVYTSYKGFKNKETKQPVTANTIFEGASISKSVFAYFVMQFVESGMLDLNKPLYQYLPYPDLADDERYKKITAKMVLCHRSGMPNWREGEPDKKLKLLFEPNTQYGYSGEAYQYLALVLKEITKTDWKGLEQLFQKKVAIPLKMGHTVFIQTDYTRKNKAEPYDENANWIDWENNYWFKKEDNKFYAASSIHTEPVDFSKWMLAIMNQKGLTKDSFETMLKPYSEVPVDELSVKYTLGFNKLDIPFTNIYFHGGDNEGFTSLYVLDIKKKWGFVLFANSENGGDFAKELFFFLLSGPNSLKLYGIVTIVLITLIILIYIFIKGLKKIIQYKRTNTMKTKITLLLLLACLTISAQNTNTVLTQKLDSLSQHNSLVGFGVAIYNKDKVLYMNGFGQADKEKRTAYTTHTVQKIASISKLLLGVSLMKAQELNLLNLDDPINNYLPFPLVNERLSANTITIRQLASHTSGLKKNKKYDLKALFFPTKLAKIKKEIPFGFKKIIMKMFVKIVNKNKELSLQDYLYKLYNPKGEWYSKLHFSKNKAGEKEVYSNQGASFLALIIEKASGMAYADFVRKHILEPLKMDNSGFDFEMDKNKFDKASLYHNTIKVPNDFKLLLYPAGGFETNIVDFSHFMVAMAKGFSDGNTILTKQSYDEMVRLPKDKKRSHAVLWETYKSSTVGHQGDIAGVTTYAYYNRSQDSGYIFFTNTAGKKQHYKDMQTVIDTLKDFYSKFDTK